MDTTHSLRCRIIELETELRLVKEQLAQDQNGILYLVSCLGRAQHQSGLRDENSLTPQILAHADKAQISSQSAFSSNFTSNCTSQLALSSLANIKNGDSNPYESTHFSNSPESLGHGFSGCEERQDLLTFDDETPSSSAKTEPSAAAGSLQSHLSEVSLVDSVLETPPTPFIPSPFPRDGLLPTSQHQPVGLGITHFNSDDEIFDSDQDFGGWGRCRSPISPEPDLIFSRPFLDDEHNRLLGAAIYIEDMSGEERETFWEQHARDSERHSPQEWELYYEHVVRPAYLTSMATRSKSIEIESGIQDGEHAGHTRQVEMESQDAIQKQGSTTSIRRPEAEQSSPSVHLKMSNGFTPVTPAAAPAQFTSIRRPAGSSDLFFNFTSTDPSLFRTVLVSNIPTGFTLPYILDHVREGTVVQATFLETAGMKTVPPMEKDAAILTFSAADEARAFVAGCLQAPLMFESEGVESKGLSHSANVNDDAEGKERVMVKASVEVIQTPSRPLRSTPFR